MSATGDVVWHPSPLTRQRYEARNGHCAKVIWLTGLPGSGKSSVAHAIATRLHDSGFQAVVLDGDNIRHGLCADLGFSVEDRNENVRRVAEVAKLFMEQGVIVFVALVSPMRNAREKVRQRFADGDFVEVYCDCSVEVCKERDPKSMYAKAASGGIQNFTGVSSSYEVPVNPDFILDTANESVAVSVDKLAAFLDISNRPVRAG